ncbi:MAG TPA: LysR substrate-binding domain-containing protein [Streptosporangiaceae bacterium]|jgi:DNA-binding transcriptional LysR family regulator
MARRIDVQLTTPGTVLLERAERLLAEAHVAALAVRESAGQLRSLRVGTFPSAAQRLVPDALASLRADHPDLELALMHFEPPDGLTQLPAGEVDAVVAHRYPGVSWPCPTGVRTTKLATDPLVSGTLDDPNRVALASARAGAGFTPHVAFETADDAATASLVRHGFAIAVVPRLAWPADTHGVARLSLRRPDGGILAQLPHHWRRPSRGPAPAQPR